MNAEEPLLSGINDGEGYVLERVENVHSKNETKFIAKSSAPLIVTFFLQYLLSVTTIYATGKLGPKELAAASLGVCTFNISGLAVYQGMSTSLDSFCSQAFGSGNLVNVGLYFQRCTLMGLIVTVFPLSFIWFFSGSILKYMIPDDDLVSMTQQFLRISMIGAPGLLFFETGKRFLQAQHLFNAGTYVLLIVVPFNFILNWLLVWHPVYGLGFIGAPIAVSIVYWLSSILMLMYVVFIDGKKCWGGLDSKALINWNQMLKLAIPGVVMVEAEYLAFEVLTILAASFGTDALAAQSIASNIGSLCFQVPFAVAVACSTRIGHYVGEKNINSARLVVKITTISACVIAVFGCSAVFFNRHLLASLFTSSTDVLKISDKILTLVAVNQIFDSFNVLGAGILRGQGRQQIGSILNMISYYIIALPLGYILAFILKFELSGLWLGLMVGVLFLAITEFICIYFSDWRRIIIENLDRHDV